MDAKKILENYTAVPPFEYASRSVASGDKNYVKECSRTLLMKAIEDYESITATLNGYTPPVEDITGATLAPEGEATQNPAEAYRGV